MLFFSLFFWGGWRDSFGAFFWRGINVSRYTIYPTGYTKEISLDTYDMAAAPGRTYRYYNGAALFEFGQGLSYTTFALACACKAKGCGGLMPVTVACSVKNTGAVAGDEVVQVYHAAGDQIRAQAKHPVPKKALVAFERVTVAVGDTVAIEFELDAAAFALTGTEGDRVVYKGKRTLLFSRGTGKDVAIPVTR